MSRPCGKVGSDPMASIEGGVRWAGAAMRAE
jgi:hypothetical protein